MSVLALLTRFWDIAHPHGVVFDEVYFRGFAADYLSGHYFFDIHPPLVKLLFAADAWLFHLSPADISSGLLGGAVLRCLPALAGAALVPLVYLIVRRVGLGRMGASLAATFVLCDNALLVESRFVLMDSLLLLFGFAALYLVMILIKQSGWQRWLMVAGAGLLLGMTVSTKWTGLAMVILVGVYYLVESIRDKIKPLKITGEIALVLGLIAAVYIGSFAIHFGLLGHSGEGDAFMSSRLQSTLIGNPEYSRATKMSFVDKFIELNHEMYTAEDSIEGTTHPYSSKWYQWPFMMKPIYYWQGDIRDNSYQGNIYLLGNPLVWWVSSLCVLVAFVLWMLRPKWLGRQRRMVAYLLVGYAANYVPFVFITRPMFLYHYLTALVISIIIAAIMIERVMKIMQHKWGERPVKRAYIGLFVATAFLFLYFLPISYGWDMSPSDLDQKMWFSDWR